MGGGGVTRGDTTQGGQEASAPEKKRGTMRGGGAMRSGQVKAPPKGRWWRDKKLRQWRTRGNTTTSRDTAERHESEDGDLAESKARMA
jgi:hypothetical protein